MNAKKIMGAVLVALLAAALFVGAGAAAVANGDTVFLYQKLDATDYNNLKGTWSNGDSALSLTDMGSSTYCFVPNENFKAGTYTNGTGDKAWSLTISYPTATIVATGTQNGQNYIIANGGNLFEGNALTLANSTGSSAQPIGYYVVDPNGVPAIKNATEAANLINATVGQFKVQTAFNASNFVTGTPVDLLVSKDVFIINVLSSNEVTVSASVESVIKTHDVAVTIVGKPGAKFTLDLTKFTYVTNGTTPYTGQTDGSGTFTIPNTGKATVYVKAAETGNGKITVKPATGETFEKQSVSIQITAGEITAATEKESYYVGNDVKITGTSTAGNTLFVYIKGTNIPFQLIPGVSISVDSGKFEKKLTADVLSVKVGSQKLDAGTYTLYISNLNLSADSKDVTIKNLDEYTTYGTATLVLKQPFLSVTDAPAVAVKGTDYKVTGTVEAAEKLSVYIFGTNFFGATNGTSNVTSTISGDIVDIDGNEFTVEFTVGDDIAAGQYFMVIQHPMYDTFFNIAAEADGDIVKNATGDATKYPNNPAVFNVWERQTANAAQALCDELDLQNIDDMYVKLSFIVAAPSSTINPIPAEITKGSKLTISGTTNLGEGETVTVEILSTAFAAVPKETVGSASFIALTTKTNEDGSWEVTFDTSGLNVDEYTVSVAVADLDATTAKINVIEGAPTEQPTENPTEQPTQTEQPTTPPTTPGFGALAALAGLGAVAVLLLRRE